MRRKEAKKAALEELTAARKKLSEIRDGPDYPFQNPEFVAANEAVLEAEWAAWVAGVLFPGRHGWDY